LEKFYKMLRWCCIPGVDLSGPVICCLAEILQHKIFILAAELIKWTASTLGVEEEFGQAL
jgi:hypothetical protein